MELEQAQPPVDRMTLTDFLAFEDTSNEKHEFHDGEVTAMAGTTPTHVRIAGNIHTALDRRLDGSPWQPFTSDLRVWVQSRRKMYYPDVSVVCGPVDHLEDDKGKTLVCNPSIIFEVISDSSERDDRGSKFAAYRDLVSLQEYILLSQDSPSVEVFRRGQDGLFVINGTVSGIDSAFELRSLRLILPLAEIYKRVAFSAPPEPTP